MKVLTFDLFHLQHFLYSWLTAEDEDEAMLGLSEMSSDREPPPI